MKIPIAVVAALLGVAAVLYFSWLPDPNIGSRGYFPDWLGAWINRNGNLRTAVPFVALGALGEWLVSRRRRGWVLGTLLALVLVAELGQLALPGRTFDWGDVAWALAGSVAGMALVALGKRTLGTTGER
jgi:glycopeptide antibiotics resistance protein